MVVEEEEEECIQVNPLFINGHFQILYLQSKGN